MLLIFLYCLISLQFFHIAVYPLIAIIKIINAKSIQCLSLSLPPLSTDPSFRLQSQNPSLSEKQHLQGYRLQLVLKNKKTSQTTAHQTATW